MMFCTSQIIAQESLNKEGTVKNILIHRFLSIGMYFSGSHLYKLIHRGNRNFKTLFITSVYFISISLSITKKLLLHCIFFSYPFAHECRCFTKCAFQFDLSLGNLKFLNLYTLIWITLHLKIWKYNILICESRNKILNSLEQYEKQRI